MKIQIISVAVWTIAMLLISCVIKKNENNSPEDESKSVPSSENTGTEEKKSEEPVSPGVHNLADVFKGKLLYHGAPDGNFYDKDPKNIFKGGGNLGPGFYATANKEYAKIYGCRHKSHPNPVLLTIAVKNPQTIVGRVLDAIEYVSVSPEELVKKYEDGSIDFISPPPLEDEGWVPDQLKFIPNKGRDHLQITQESIACP